MPGFTTSNRHYVFFPIGVCPTVVSPITVTPTYIETCAFAEYLIEMGVVPTYSTPTKQRLNKLINQSMLWSGKLFIVGVTV